MRFTVYVTMEMCKLRKTIWIDLIATVEDVESKVTVVHHDFIKYFKHGSRS